MHYHKRFRLIRKQDLDTKFTNCELTYAEIFRAAEELVNKDKVKLGKYTFIVKRREFKDIHRDNFSSGFRPLSE
jgi:hypothetical protein